MSKATLAIIMGNRDFFPDSLVSEARVEILSVVKELDIEPLLLDESDTKLGAVETWTHAQRCAELFRANRERIEGILITLPNFGDEKGVADTIRLAGLDVPILVQAYPDDLDQLMVERRRDSFCGKVSVCNVLRQYGLSFTLTEEHTVHPLSDSFKQDLQRFVSVCRVVRGLRTARFGAVGSRPGAFNTMRYSEKLLEASGISITTLDLSDVYGWAEKLKDDDPRVSSRMTDIMSYADATAVPPKPLLQMAKLGVVLSGWMKENGIRATGIQCWASLQKNFGINACTLMSMMGEALMPSACETDMTGVVAMYALQLASGKPSALADWNNNYGSDPDKCVLFHCGNWPRSFLQDAKIGQAEILGSTLGNENTYGALAGRTPAGPVTFARVTTDDQQGCIRCYLSEGYFTDDPLKTFGARAVVQVPGLKKLMQYICKNGFEHHVAISLSHSAAVLAEVFENYLAWETYSHQG